MDHMPRQAPSRESFARVKRTLSRYPAASATRGQPGAKTPAGASSGSPRE